jgi:hypothetical protein
MSGRAIAKSQSRTPAKETSRGHQTWQGRSYMGYDVLVAYQNHVSVMATPFMISSVIFLAEASAV